MLLLQSPVTAIISVFMLVGGLTGIYKSTYMAINWMSTITLDGSDFPEAFKNSKLNYPPLCTASEYIRDKTFILEDFEINNPTALEIVKLRIKTLTNMPQEIKEKKIRENIKTFAEKHYDGYELEEYFSRVINAYYNLLEMFREEATLISYPTTKKVTKTKEVWFKDILDLNNSEYKKRYHKDVRLEELNDEMFNVITWIRPGMGPRMAAFGRIIEHTMNEFYGIIDRVDEISYLYVELYVARKIAANFFGEEDIIGSGMLGLLKNDLEYIEEKVEDEQTFEDEKIIGENKQLFDKKLYAVAG